MKKAISFVLAFFLVLFFTACGESSSNSSGTTESVPTTTQEPAETPKETPKVETTEENAVLPVEVKEFGYSMSGDYLYYSIHLYNPNDKYIVGYPSFRVTARDADGVLLGTQEQTLVEIYPNHDSWHAFMAFSVEEEPATVDVEILPAPDYGIKKVSAAEHTDFKPLAVINTAMRDGSIGKKFVGEVKNDNDYDIKRAVVTIVFRDDNGTLIGGDSCFVENVPAGGTAPFETSMYIKFLTDNYEAYADNWM